MLRQILFGVEVISWQLRRPHKKGEQSKWRSEAPKIFTPPFMDKKKKGEEMAMPIDDLNKILSAPRVEVK